MSPLLQKDPLEKNVAVQKNRAKTSIQLLLTIEPFLRYFLQPI